MDVLVTQLTSYLVVLFCSSMESVFSLLYRMDTFFQIDKFFILICLAVGTLMCLGAYIKESILGYIMPLVVMWYIMLRSILKKDAMETPAGSQGSKKKTRLDAADDASRQNDSARRHSLEFSASDEVLPEAPEPPQKSRRRHKRRRNLNKSKYKSMMDDSSETSSNSDLPTTKTYVQPEQTKVYSPLPMYVQLKLDDYSLYHQFEKYLCTREQLRINGFPEESPVYPGRASFRYQKVEKGSTKRRCCRCTSVFHILPDGRYEAKEPCRYHLKRQVPFRQGDSYCGDFPCCSGNYLSVGCMTGQYHVTQESFLEDIEFARTKHKKHLSKAKAFNVYALDCEMLYTTAGMEVVKVGVVGLNGLTIYESFVLPQNPILDYNTTYSGVTEKDLKGIITTLADVQCVLQKLFNRDSILVGHGLENDLKALRLIHGKIVDTSVVFPHPYTKHHKKSLRNLAHEFLNKQIQQSKDGHNCIEDARTCLELLFWKIGQDLKDRPLVLQDENKNSVLQNTIPTVEQGPKKFTFSPESCYKDSVEFHPCRTTPYGMSERYMYHVYQAYQNQVCRNTGIPLRSIYGDKIPPSVLVDYIY